MSSLGSLMARHPILFVALIAGAVVYLPAINSPFLGDDYILLLASRDMSWPDFLRSSLVPGADPGVLRLSETYWRPLSFLTFRLLYIVFGAEPLPYHLFSLGIHLASVGLVYALALRLRLGKVGSATAALVMAVHPAGFESITWIASLNSAGLPLALAAWLAFMRATEATAGNMRNRWLATSLVLVLMAIGYRETSAVVSVAMLAWYLGIQRRGRLRERETLVFAGSHLALLWVVALLSGSLSDNRTRGLADFDAGAIRNWWFYLEQAVIPVRPLSPAWARYGQPVGACLLLGALALAALKRRWLIAVLGGSFLLALIPYAAFSLGRGERYFYMPCALFALAAGALVNELAPRLRAKARVARAELLAPAVLVVPVAIYGAITFSHVSEWVDTYPDVNEAWVRQLKTEYPELPENGGIFAANTPGPLAILDAYILQTIVDYLYLGEHHPVYWAQPQYYDYLRSVMKPEDRWFTYQPE